MTNPHRVKKDKRGISEVRQDLVSGTWVVIATGRARRPEDYKKQKREKFEAPTTNCPFCYPEKTGQREDVLIYYKKTPAKTKKSQAKREWSLRVFPNKYPAFVPLETLEKREEGPFHLMDGVGFHEVIVTRDHRRQIAEFSTEEIVQVIDAYQSRYLALMNRKFIDNISIFHNHGREAGASIVHPHSQLIALPVVDPDVHRSLEGSENYFRANKRCVHCTMIEWEMESKKRIVFENSDFVVFCPFVSRTAFEIRIYPKDHKSYFERITEREKSELAEAFQMALNKIYKGLDDPAYNFFLHTAPCDGKAYDQYHWHFEIFPKTAIWAGFELGTGIEISTIEPEKAAEFLRKV
ncbi:MAG TPA: DUF4921 family protein [Candidatus Portnoybacteria bacterium]|nr:DUF4921 family protein [Candidatus Portnoybacteria bacterium]